MKRIIALGGMAACALAACTPPDVVGRYSAETEYRGETYPVECTQYFGQASVAVQVPTNFASCSVEVDGKNHRCRTIYQDLPEVPILGVPRDWRPNQAEIDQACSSAVRSALASDAAGGGGGYTPPRE